VLLEASRAQVAVAARRLVIDRLVTGTSGNVSARDPETGHVAITPSGVSYADLAADDIVLVDASGTVVDGDWLPSSELPMHLAVYRLRPDVLAVVHTHSPHATAFAACGREIPAIHYDIAAIGNPIRVAPYATYGTDELASSAVRAMGADQAVLLQNHGVLAVGSSVEHAYLVAQKVEYLAEVYAVALRLGEPTILPQDEIEKVRSKLKHYGQQQN
jgi:L-fuculose-phosphate aldolase